MIDANTEAIFHGRVTMTRLELLDTAKRRARKLIRENAACSDTDFQKFKEAAAESTVDEELGVLRLAISFLEDALADGRHQAEAR